MLAKKVVREVMAIKGVGTGALADRLRKPDRLISDRLSLDKGTNISVDKLSEMLRALDYKIVIVPNNERMKQDWFEID